ncbi:AAA family ATPase [Anaerobranca gottschalkii]|uniref:Exonuclease SbcC n=1 Tax=Anaerobranca gottschalkii DSM 13577 TaxID=1120990 RepID=A0A1I0B493_9FIRM|nr:AAA family ATPase [Anaerobranca gottschalkii]SET00796.1 exonuclease SbcC [Anaerobranca gottschalkii DSM 13577]
MKIKKYSCSQFGGLKGLKVELKEGLNVILGPNEAGKSTVVEGIYATLFKGHKLRNNNNEDKNFIKRFKPIPSGDFFDGHLSFYKENREYTIRKRWGVQPECRMELPDGSEILDENNIQLELSKILSFGEKTYKNIIFSKQGDLKRAIDLILNDQDVVEDVSTFLRKVVMELDGISVDKLKGAIEREYNELYDKWNPNIDRPESINRPKRIPKNSILEKYYQLEDKKIELKNSTELEKKLAELNGRLKALEEQKGEILEKLKEYSKVELDVSKRAQIQPQIKMLTSVEKELREINYNWPKIEEKHKNALKEKEKVEEELKGLKEELENARKIKEKENLSSKVNKIKESLSELKKKEGDLSLIPKITNQDIQSLERLRNSIEKIRTAIKAGKMRSKILKSTVPVWVTKDFDNKEQYRIEQEITAEGYLKIEFEGIGELEIQSGEFNFNQLKEELENKEKELKERLEELRITTIEEGKVNKERIDNLNRDIERIKTSIDILLNGESLESLEEKLKSMEMIQLNKGEGEIERELEEKGKRLRELEIELGTLKSKLEEWIKEYKSPEKILDLLVEKKAEIKSLEEQLKVLAPLPPEFVDTDQFFASLGQLRKKERDIEEQLKTLEKDYYKLEMELPDVSSEEIAEEVKNLEKELQILKDRGRKIQIIKKVFEEKLAEMDRDSFKPLENSFKKYLAFLTDNRYQVTEIKDNLHVEIKKEEVPMPIELLSTGTKDSVALALRLAIIEVLYGENPGIIVLDDCLVDLDPNRKEKGIKLIQEFAKNNQVIFTTCNPQTAEELGGNLIKILPIEN